MAIPHLPSIGDIEGYVAQLIALILLILGGARLVIHEWHAVKRTLRGRQNHAGPRGLEGPAP